MNDKYLIIIGSLKKGGAERNAALLANYLVSKGHHVTIAIFNKEIAFDICPDVHFEQINHKKFKLKILNVLYVLIKLRSLINRVNPKRLIAMSRIASLFAASTLFTKTIVRFDSYPLIGYKKSKQLQFWLFYNLPWVKYVICPSKELNEDINSYFINKRKLKTIYNPVPLLGITKSADQFLDKKPYFIVVSRLAKQKNIDKIIWAFSQLQDNNVNLLIVGDGPEMENLKFQVSDIGLETRVLFKGFVSNPYPYIENSLALLSASLREGFPNVLIEALSLGTPVISSKAKTGPKEIIFDGENGFLFPPNDYNKLIELMHLIIRDEKKLDYLRNNTGKGLERFSHQSVMKEWETVL